jgi:hypothetical protein
MRGVWTVHLCTGGPKNYFEFFFEERFLKLAHIFFNPKLLLSYRLSKLGRLVWENPKVLLILRILSVPWRGFA